MGRGSKYVSLIGLIVIQILTVLLTSARTWGFTIFCLPDSFDHADLFALRRISGGGRSRSLPSTFSRASSYQIHLQGPLVLMKIDCEVGIREMIIFSWIEISSSSYRSNRSSMPTQMALYPYDKILSQGKLLSSQYKTRFIVS